MRTKPRLKVESPPPPPVTKKKYRDNVVVTGILQFARGSPGCLEKYYSTVAQRVKKIKET